MAKSINAIVSEFIESSSLPRGEWLIGSDVYDLYCKYESIIRADVKIGRNAFYAAIANNRHEKRNLDRVFIRLREIANGEASNV
jgi:hypothetical protein